MSPKTKHIGTVLPLSSLASRLPGQGTFVQGSLFLDWLSITHQTIWQLLPLHETQLEPGSTSKHVPSPYKGYGIGLDPKYLSADLPLPSSLQIQQFVDSNSDWIHTYTLFSALRDKFGTDNWTQWPAEIKTRDPLAIERWSKQLSTSIKQYEIEQTKLHLSYQNLQIKARELNILLIADMPFYLGLSSPLVWEYQDLFDLDRDLELSRVSGIPLGPKAHFGRQVWGHPLYAWQNHGAWPDLGQLFKLRIKYLAQLFDWVRFDHAKGLFHYGVIDLRNDSLDQYLPGPGRPFLRQLILYARGQGLEIYAEDSGDKLADLRLCLRQLKIPGIKIFRFAYNEKRQKYDNEYLETAHYPSNSFAYTTNHDTETLMGYLELLSSQEIKTLEDKIGIEPTQDLEHLAVIIRTKVLGSPAKFVLIPLQDWLLSTERINIPGQEKEIDDPNWRYIMPIAIEDLPTNLLNIS